MASLAPTPLAHRWRATARPRPWTVAALPAYRLIAAMVAVALCLAAALGFAWDGHDLPLMIGLLTTIVMLGWLLRTRGQSRVAAMLEGSSLLLAACMATACLSVLFATSALPYRDAQLAQIDGWLMPWLSWRDMFTALHRQHLVVAAMTSIYTSLLWQPFVLVAALATTGEESDAWRFVTGWSVALALCVIVFPLVPAMSAYPYYHINDATIPAMTVHVGWHQWAVLDPIRHGATRLLSPATMTGMITYPSFHAAGATLLAWGFRRVPLIGMPFILLNIAMAMTAPLIGSHYFIDIVAGITVAVVAIRVAART